jgi:hypothetical protein
MLASGEDDGIEGAGKRRHRGSLRSLFHQLRCRQRDQFPLDLIEVIDYFMRHGWDMCSHGEILRALAPESV